MNNWKGTGFLEIRAYSDHPEVSAAARVLIDHYFANKQRKKDEDKLFRDAKKLIASLWLHPSDMFRFTTKTEYFTKEKRKQVWMTQRVLKLFNLMRKIGWVNDAIPAVAPYATPDGDDGLAAIYARSHTFRKLLTNLTVADIDVNPDLPRLQHTVEVGDVPDLDHELVLATDHKVHRLDSYTRWVIEVLEAQWELLKQFTIKNADGSLAPKADHFYHQSLRGHDRRGGRYYAPFCTYSKQDRLGITIDGEAVGSLDISQTHPTILLAMQGMQSEADMMGDDAPEDAYTMSAYPEFERDLHKVLVNILYNAKSEDAACRAYLNTHHWIDSITGEYEIKTYKGKTRGKRKGKPVFQPNRKPQAEAYIAAYKKEHPAFVNVICSGIAGDLQSIDSNLAIKMIDVMTQAGVPVLTVHDEFIVRKEDRWLVEMTLCKVAKHVLQDVIGERWGCVRAKWETLEGREAVELDCDAEIGE